MTAVPWPFVVLVGVLGLAIGSFLNVVIYRVPRGESIAFPGSHCPLCSKPIKARHNVPLVGWLMLRGKCASCAAPISARYPLVEVGTSLLMVAITLRFGFSIDLPAYLFFAAVAITLALIDLDLRKLPDTIVLPAYIVASLLLIPSGAAAADWHPAARAAIGIAALSAVYFALLVACPKGFTSGDIKLAGLLGLYLGWMSWGAILIGAVVGLVVGGLTAMTCSVIRPKRTVIAVAYGPCMIAGAATALFVTVPVLGWYVSLLGAA
jgi:leader peptidase (prepilin peptidase)/N-methyltransferase